MKQMRRKLEWRRVPLLLIQMMSGMSRQPIQMIPGLSTASHNELPQGKLQTELKSGSDLFLPPRRMNCRTHTHTYYACNTIMLCAHVCTRDENWFDCGINTRACFVSSLESSPIPPIVSGTSAYCNSINDIFGAVTGTPTILS